MKSMQRGLQWFQLIGVLLFLYIFLQLDIPTVLLRLHSFRLEWLAVYAFCFAFSALFKALRWQSALTVQGTSLPMSKIIRITAVSSFYGIVTPGRVGEFSKIVYLIRENLSVPRGLVTVILDRLYDFAFLFIFGTIASIYFLDFFLGEVNRLIVILASLFVLTLSLFLLRRGLWRLLKRILWRILSTEEYNTVAYSWEEFKVEFIRVLKPSMSKMIFFTFLVYGFYFAQISAVAKGFIVSVPIVYLSFCLVLSSLISLLPISIGGLGTREAIFISLLGKLSVPPEAAALVAFMDGTVFGISLSGILALVFSLSFRKYATNDTGMKPERLTEAYRNKFSLQSVRDHWNTVAPIYDAENKKFGYAHIQRFDEAFKHVELRPGQLILDVFTRTGNGIYYYKQRCPDTTMIGVELSENMLKLAQRKLPQNPFVQSSPHSLPFRDEVFDVIFSLETLEHVPSPVDFLQELYRVMKPDGQLIMSLPPATAQYTSVISDLLSIGHGEGPHRFLPSSTVKYLLRGVGFKLVLHKGTVLLPVGPETLKRWVAKHEHLFQGTFVAELGIRQFYVCKKNIGG